MLKLIAQLPYFKIERLVTGFAQETVEQSRILYLYEDKVVTAHHEFPIEQVNDFSFRAIAQEGGLLYLHSTRGVFSYQVKTSPEEFIETYKSYFKASQ